MTAISNRMHYRGTWGSSVAYLKQDVIIQGGGVYVAVASSTNSQPPSANWQVIGSIEERALGLGISGAVPTSTTDGADMVVAVPFNMTLIRMKATCNVAPTGAMAVQLRRSTNNVTPSYSNVTGFVATYTASHTLAAVDPADVDVNEGDLLNLSVSTGSGTNLLVEVVARIR